MTEPKDIETQIKERQELLERCEQVEFTCNENDRYEAIIKLGKTAPQFESDLIKGYHALKKAYESEKRWSDRFKEQLNESEGMRQIALTANKHLTSELQKLEGQIKGMQEELDHYHAKDSARTARNYES